MNERQSSKAAGESPDDHLTKAGNRVFACMTLLAGFSGVLTTLGNLIRGGTDPVSLTVAVAGIAFCFLSGSAVFWLKRYRLVVITGSSFIIQAVLMWLAIATGLLLSTPILYLLMMVPALTAISGTWAGGLSAIAAITSFAYIYMTSHADNQVLYVASSYIDWRLVMFGLSVCAVFLWAGTSIYHHQMMKAARHLEASRIVAETSERAKSDFLANMSHEIRTPMNGVIGMLDVTLAHDMPGHQRQSLEVARRSAESLIRVLTDILDLTKLEQGHIEIDCKPTNLQHLIEDAATLFSSAAAAKGVDLLTKGVKGLPPYALIDGQRTGQILSNLLANAVKFTDDGTITLSARYQDGVLMIGVEDTGCGMPKAFLPNVFKRFQQAETGASSRRGGTGLGLAICRDLTELMDGHIGVTSEEGQGTRFDVALPAPVANSSTDDVPEQSAVALDAASQDRHVDPLHILVAEDNPVNRSVIGAFLTRLGHSFVDAEDGHDACEFAREGNFDMIIMDVSMPRMDGIEATRTIRALDIPIADAPIIMLTAHAEDRYINACMEAGADAILHKPITRAALAAVIAGVLKDQQSENTTVTAAR
ncbi:MAG: ATP-binding protein [Pseudomonadota bacterium]